MSSIYKFIIIVYLFPVLLNTTENFRALNALDGAGLDCLNLMQVWL